MEKGNVLVLGNSGVGKSTLINAVLGENRAEIGCGTEGTTKELKIYENNTLPFRLIDSVGFEPSFWKERQAIKAVQKWAKNSANAANEDRQIDLIWFCIDGTARKLFSKTLKDLSQATSVWKSVPVIVTITKSYSVPDRESNIEMVKKAFDEQKRCRKNLKKIIPVVAQTYVLNEQAFAPPEGIEDLISTTVELMPEGIQAGKNDIDAYILARKRALAQSLVSIATISGVTVAAVPIPYPDTVILTPIELAEVNGIAHVYGIAKSEKTKQFINSILQIGVVTTTAKTAVVALKAIPGIRIGAAVINAIIAGSIITALGEGSIYIFEQIHLGNRTMDDIDWITKVMDSQFAGKFNKALNEILKKIDGTSSMKDIADVIFEMFQK